MRSPGLLIWSLIAVAACGRPARAPSTPANVPPPAPRAPSARPAHPDGEPAGFLFVDDFDRSGGAFNGRPYAISLNAAIPGHDPLRAALAWRLADAGVVDQVAVERFGETPPTHVEIHVGDGVPVAIVQAVLDVYGHQGHLPLRVGVSADDGGFGDRQRIYVGSLVESVAQPLTAAQLAALLDPTLSLDQLHRLLPTVPD